jgi:hypothetical protein
MWVMFVVVVRISVGNRHRCTNLGLKAKRGGILPPFDAAFPVSLDLDVCRT